jgi:hypothetical protein
MKPIVSLWLMAAIFLATVSIAEAQQLKVPQIAYLSISSGSGRPNNAFYRVCEISAI